MPAAVRRGHPHVRRAVRRTAQARPPRRAIVRVQRLVPTGAFTPLNPGHRRIEERAAVAGALEGRRDAHRRQRAQIRHRQHARVFAVHGQAPGLRVHGGRRHVAANGGAPVGGRDEGVEQVDRHRRYAIAPCALSAATMKSTADRAGRPERRARRRASPRRRARLDEASWNRASTSAIGAGSPARQPGRRGVLLVAQASWCATLSGQRPRPPWTQSPPRRHSTPGRWRETPGPRALRPQAGRPRPRRDRRAQRARRASTARATRAALLATAAFIGLDQEVGGTDPSAGASMQSPATISACSVPGRAALRMSSDAAGRAPTDDTYTTRPTDAARAASTPARWSWRNARPASGPASGSAAGVPRPPSAARQPRGVPRESTGPHVHAAVGELFQLLGRAGAPPRSRRRHARRAGDAAQRRPAGRRLRPFRMS